MHGILMIKTLQGNISDAAGMDTDGADVDMDDATGVDAGVDAVKTLQCNVSIRQPHDASRMGQPHNANCTNNIMRNISPKPGSISTIIRSYKSVTTKNAKKIDANFGWQTRFYDHIIRNNQAFTNIHHYIRNNPQKWETDKFFN